MADPTTPLLPPSSPKSSSSPAASLDDMIERCVGSLGPAQLLQALLVSLSWLFDAQQTFVTVFTDAPPPWRCTGCGGDHRPPTPCGLPDGAAWSWDRPAPASVVSEWSLQCAGAALAGLPSSAYFAGCLAGGLLLATLADSTLGRKRMLCLSCLGMASAGVLTAASPNVWVYAALRFAGGFARATISTSALVLSTELVGKRWRGEVGILGFLFFPLGFLSLPAMAFANRNSSWRMLYLWTSAPALLYSALVHFFVRESPRWLLVRGRREEAVRVLKDIAASNGKDVLSYSFSGFNAFAGEEEDCGTNSSRDVYSALRVLVGKPWAVRRLAAVMAAGFGIGTVYYGMPLAVGSLGSDLYLGVVLSALSEIPSAFITFFLIGGINRRGAVLGFTLAGGACSAACVFLGEAGETGARTAAEVASFFCACTAFNVVLIYTLELFPTSVRNSALSMVRQALVLGGMAAPLLVAASRGRGSAGGVVTFGVFAVVIAGCGLFVVCLPETRGGGICDTLEEQECRDRSKGVAGAGEGEGESNPSV
uniref:H(+)/Pi cotransporter n=1 Tax=Anthurium amnicola TaxID=1678845 RepID=A0A1D1YN88_9ARAE